LQAAFDLVIGLDQPPADLHQHPAASQAETGFSVLLVDADGQMLASVPITEPNINHDGFNSLPFLVGLPQPAGARSLQIQQDGQTLAERAISAGTPEITLLSPNGGEVYESPFEIQWSASDPDEDPLTYTLQYSPDAGASWQAIAFGLTGNSYQVLSLNNLTGSDQAKIRVIASDGGNSASDESDGVFILPNTPPMPVIQSPGHQAIFPQAQRVPLAASATDREDGVLPAEALSWESSLDGFLGSGDLLEPDNLSPGNHVLTLTAEDSDGATAQATIGIVIDPDNVRPLVSDEDLATLNRILAAGPDYQPDGSALPAPLLLVVGAAVAGLLILGLGLLWPLARSWLRRER
jgi:hypothetical protein